MAVGLMHAARAAGNDPPSVAGHSAITFQRGHEVTATSTGPLDDEAVEEYRKAGEVLHTVLGESAGMVKPDVTHFGVAEHTETRIRGFADGCAFPVNININGEASYTGPNRDDDTVFGEDMVCLGIGVHVDGYIADSAVAVNLLGNDGLVESAEEALDAAPDMVEAGTHIKKIGAEIEDAIRGCGYTPVLNLSGYGVEQWDAHTDPTILDRDAEHGVELGVSNVIAIEPFAIDGTGKVTEGSKNEIYSLANDRSVRNRMSRKLLNEMREEYKLLPFTAHQFEGGRSEVATRRLEQQSILHGYPVLKKEDGAMVEQAEDTIIVTEDGYENLTR